MNNITKPEDIKIGVYKLVPLNNEYCKYKLKGHVHIDSNFNDDVISLDFLKQNKDKNYKIMGNKMNKLYLDDEIYFQFFKDKVTSVYMTKTDKIPIFHCSIMYEKKVVVGSLFNIYLYFNIEDAKKYTSFKKLTRSEIKGKYELAIEKIDFNNKIVSRELLPLENFTNFNDLITNLTNLFFTEDFKKIIYKEYEQCEKERLKKHGYDNIKEYVVPEADKIIKFDDLIEKYEKEINDKKKLKKKKKKQNNKEDNTEENKE